MILEHAIALNTKTNLIYRGLWPPFRPFPPPVLSLRGGNHGTVDHGHPSDGVFLLIHLWVLPSRRSILRVEDPSGARKGGLNRRREWARPAGLGRPAQAHPGPAWSPLRARGSSGDYALCPLHLHDFGDVILASKMEVLCAWSSVFYTLIPGVFLRSTSVLATIGSDFVKLMNTNKTP
jgi:hypothetical protein